GAQRAPQHIRGVASTRRSRTLDTEASEDNKDTEPWRAGPEHPLDSAHALKSAKLMRNSRCDSAIRLAAPVQDRVALPPTPAAGRPRARRPRRTPGPPRRSRDRQEKSRRASWGRSE